MTKVYTSIFKKGNKLMVRSIDQETGTRYKEQIDYQPFLYVETKRPEKQTARSLIDEPLERVDFPTINDFMDFQEKYKNINGFKMFGCKNPVYQYIAQAYPGQIKYDFNYIRGNIVDIEVNSGELVFDDTGKPIDMKPGPFPEPEHAKYPINAVTIYDTKTNVFFVLGLEVFQGHKMGTYVHDPKHEKIGACKVIYKGYDDEIKLLMDMMNLFAKMEPDFISGWNSQGFDEVYIINRVKNVLGDEWAKKISPWNYIRQKTHVGAFGKEQITYDIYGVASLDYKDLVDKHADVELANKKLNTAGEHFLGEGKLDHSEAKNLSRLYFLNYQKFITYNIQDVNLIVRMDAKLKFFNLVYILAYCCHCNPEDTLGTVAPWSSMLYEKAHNRGQEPELKSPYPGDTEYLGAFVQEPVPGMYRWGVSIDANALYPHTAMQYNMGPDTMLSEQEGYKVRMMLVKELDQQEQTPYIRRLKECIRNKELINEFYWEETYVFKTLKELNLTMTPNIVFFKRDRVSIISETFDELYTSRKVVKKEMLQVEQQVVDLKEEHKKTQIAELVNQIFKLENKVTALHNEQLGIKIIANAGYGGLGNKWMTEYFSINLAEGITSGGQVSLRFTMKKINQYLNEKVGTNNHNFIITGDTDSIYMCLDPLVKKECHGLTDEQIVDWLDNLFKTEIEPKLLEWAEELSNALNCYKSRLVFKRETIFLNGIFTAKKRYALMVADSEGVRYPKPKLKITGLDAKKSDCPAFCRDYLKECYVIALTKTEKDLHQKVKEVKADFMQRPIHQIATPKSVNGLEKYYIDGQFQPKTPPQVKAAVHYNNMVKELNLAEPLINSGDKLLYVQLKKGAPYGMQVIGFPDYLPSEFDLDKHVDKVGCYEKSFISPLYNFLDAIKWNHEPQASLMDFFS